MSRKLKSSPQSKSRLAKNKPANSRQTNSPENSAVKTKAVVGIIMGSDSDLKTMEGAIECLTEFGVRHEIRVVSAHRTPQAMIDYGTSAFDRGIKVIIAGAGGAAHLPGMIAAVALIPVIGVPVNITNLNGLDALLSVVQMPKGVPVATVAIDNSFNAGLLAARILALSDAKLIVKLERFRGQQVKKVKSANLRLKLKKTK